MTVVEPAEHLPLWMGGPVRQQARRQRAAAGEADAAARTDGKLRPDDGKGIDAVSASSGLPSDQIRLLICLLGAVPLGCLFRALPGATAKHLFSVVVGAFFSWFVVGWTFLHVPLSALLVYILVQVVPRSIAPTVVFVTTVGWLSALHIWRLYVDYMGWSLDATMILMIWTVKASTFAYNVADGEALKAGQKLSDRESTHTFRADRALVTLPSLLEYFSYVFFFGGVLVGPCFEAKEYFDFVSGALLKKHHLKSLPQSILPSLKCVVLGLMMYGGIFVASLYPMIGYIHTVEFGALPYVSKFIYFWIAITASRFKYYFAWLLGEAGCVATGFGFNGLKDGKGAESYRWDRLSNCDVLAVELAPHMSDVTNNWNIGVNNWLKNYVYFRVQAPRFVVRTLGIPQKSFMNLVTKATSAFWHGFYPSYYVFFLGAWLAGEMDDAMRASFEPAMTPEQKKARAKGWWKGPTNLYELCSWALCICTLNFWGVTFALLRADYSWNFAKNMCFIGVLLPVVVTALCRTVFRRKRVKTVDASAAPTATAGSAASPTSPLPTVVSAVSISAASPIAPTPSHDVVHVSSKSIALAAAADVAAGAVPEEEPESLAERVKSRPRRSRSNKAE